MIQQGFIPILVDILGSSRTSVAKEALWAISNATTYPDQQIIECLVHNGVIQGLCMFFKNKFYNQPYHQSNDQLLMVSLECIQNILNMDNKETHPFADQFESYQGLEFLEYLQSDDTISQAIYDSAVSIIKIHFGADDDNHNNHNGEGQHCEVDIVATDINGQFGFGLNTKSNDNDQSQNGNSFKF